MKENNEEKNLEVSDVITRTEEYIEKNKKMIITVVCAVVVVALAIWAYFGLYANPRQVRAAEEIFAAEQWFNESDYVKALDGDEDYLGFAQIIDQYGSTKSGNLAKYYAGICQINLGNYEAAIKYLKGYKGHDIFTEAEAEMLIGDAYVELDNWQEAVSYYEKAARANDNFVTAPAALWKAAMAYKHLGNSEKALKCLKTIKENYPESTEWSEVDKYIAFIENM